MSAGLRPHQYAWCERCGSYTGMRAQNLTKPCKGKLAHKRESNRLQLERNPNDNTPLATPPRRMSARDVDRDTIVSIVEAVRTVFDEAPGVEGVRDEELHTVSQFCCVEAHSRDPSSVAIMSRHHHEEGDKPFGLGFILG